MIKARTAKFQIGQIVRHRVFSFRGVIKPVSTMADMGTVLSQHPLFPSAWAQKLCYYANSEACVADDPEFQRSIRWVLLHLIEETARHAGHADIIRESIDGSDADSLAGQAIR